MAFVLVALFNHRLQLLSDLSGNVSPVVLEEFCTV